MNKKSKNYRMILYFAFVVVFFITLYFSLNKNAYITFTSLKDILYKPFHDVSNNKKDVVGTNINEELLSENKELKKLTNISGSLAEFNTINATIIERNASYWMESMTINKGKEDGVDIGMAVVVGEGLIGKVINITNNTSLIRLITSTHNNNKISVKIKYGETYIYKVLEYENNELVIKGIDNSIELDKNLTVLTSGLSDIYPSGIIVGKIIKIESDKYGTSKRAIVETLSDLNNLRFVTVLSRKD